MTLRNILYADNNALNNYVSQIDGYTYEEATIVNSSNKDKGGKAGFEVANFNFEGNLSRESIESSTKTAKITEASKLDKIIKYLDSEKELKYYESIEEPNWDDICRDDFLEVLVTPRFSKMEELSHTAKNIKNLVSTFQPFMDNKMLDSKTEDALNGFESLSKINGENSITCVFNFDNNKYPLIGYLDENYLKISREKFISQCYMLCKVQRKITKGESIELDEIFENFKSLALNREQRRNMPKDLSNPEMLKDKIKGPAFVVIPIAIYQ